MKPVGFALLAQHWPGTPPPSSPDTCTGPSYTQGQIFIYRAAVQGIQILSQEKGASLFQDMAAAGKTHHPGKGHHIPSGEGLTLPEHQHHL